METHPPHPPLSSFATTGGCACKLGQDDLRSILSRLPSSEGIEADLLVGNSTCDDAAVFRIVGDTAIAQTVDFFTPIVDDPYVFGQIAAANAISDIYAMGATPILGLAIAGFPTDKLPLDVLESILRGGADKAAEAGFSVAGGHTIIDDVPKYGLVVTGIVSVEKIVRNSTARAGDLLYLTKPIGTGILVTSNRSTKPNHVPHPLDEAIRWMTTLNRDVAKAMVDAGASAATDVTGYGLIGHLLEMCEGSGTGAELHAYAVPVLAGAREELVRGFRSGGTMRNVKAFRNRVRLSASESELTLMCDAQTSGGLLIAIAPERARALEAGLNEGGLFYAKVGAMTADSGHITLVA
ncbi:MAG TPA: selenide, water dikinase SelD [Thermoanaerobaculia bacterium]|jgi:selenide,water dikinase|nr:selenide, water dikinase SelD [Thermoanaerobaculia bacterium]